MTDKVLYIEGFNEIPDEIRDYLERGWTVYNAPRPIMGHELWQGEFRHGIFYAAVAPDGDLADEFGDALEFHKRNAQDHAFTCQIVTKDTVMAYGELIAKKYKVTLAEFDYEDIVASYLGHLGRT